MQICSPDVHTLPHSDSPSESVSLSVVYGRANFADNDPYGSAVTAVACVMAVYYGSFASDTVADRMD